MNGIDLLHEFKDRRSESAFGELVCRYTNLVFSVAKRRLGNQALAQDAAQTVFVRLASQPPRLTVEAELTAWLHRTTVHVSIDLWRAEVRRRSREEHAATMQLNSHEDLSWREIAPEVDEALNELNDADRRTILLRFFDQKSMRALGDDLGISEDAAKMRVSRALDRLRDRLQARGVTCTGIALGAFLTERAVEAAPAGVTAALAAGSYLTGGGVGWGAAGAAGWLPGALVAKVAIGCAVVGFVAVGVWMGQPRTAPARAPAAPGTAASGAETISSISDSGAVARAGQGGNSVDASTPDPVRLLQGVLRARQRIVSGSIEFQVETFSARFQNTNRLRIAAVFDGSRQRFEQVGREYSYSYDPDPVRQEEIKAKADGYGFDKAGAIRAGLLKPFESRYVTTHDGTTLMRYWENDGNPNGTTVNDPSKGSSSFIFDPRCLGLAPHLYPGSSMERILGADFAGSVEMIGKETVEGVLAWHVRVPGDQPRDFWLDVSLPARVLQMKSGSTTVISRYEPGASSPVLPKEVVTTEFRDGVVDFQTCFARTTAQFNIAVEPSTFTLAGLGMKPGTPVTDVRIMRGIGFWNGSELSEEMSRKSARTPKEQPTLQEMMDVLDNFPASSIAAFDAAQWILLHVPDGPEVEKAAAVILGEHVRSPEVFSLCQELDRMRHRCAGDLLQAVLTENPDLKIRMAACFTLATLRKDQCRYGADKKLTAEAENLFQRVVNEAGPVGSFGADLAWKSKKELTKLRQMTIGKAAPDLVGTDLDGRKIRLSDQRGRVVVVVFCDSTYQIPGEHVESLKPFEGKAVTWIGIHCDDDPDIARTAVEQKHIPWPVIMDGRSGPIAEAWQIDGWPSVYVLDRNGIIRAREARGRELTEVVGALLE